MLTNAAHAANFALLQLNETAETRLARAEIALRAAELEREYANRYETACNNLVRALSFAMLVTPSTGERTIDNGRLSGELSKYIRLWHEQKQAADHFRERLNRGTSLDELQQHELRKKLRGAEGWADAYRVGANILLLLSASESATDLLRTIRIGADDGQVEMIDAFLASLNPETVTEETPA
jgi:hypothetical protein